jgi:hypothetical protein
VEKYFALYTSEDGEVYMSEHTKEDMEQKLNEQHWGVCDIRSSKCIPTNVSEWPVGLLIIKGEVVTPVVKEVVKVLALP